MSQMYLNDFSKVLPINELKGKNVLFLQGPLGNFFKNLTTVFEEEYGVKQCFQIVFNKGDEFFSPKKNRVVYNKPLTMFNEWITDFYLTQKIDYVFLLGDVRLYHERAIKIAKKFKIVVYVFEEGYFRPNFITLEKGGVNNNSMLPKDINFYLNQNIDELRTQNQNKNYIVGYTYPYMAVNAIKYYVLMYLFRSDYPFYRHHRTRSPWKEAYAGINNFIKKQIKRFSEIKKKDLIKEKYGNYFFVVLQVREDFQVREHSKYKSIEHYLEEVIESFKKHRSENDLLVIKHHPMDRGKVDYQNYIDEVCFFLKMKKEYIIYVYDLGVPFILRGAKGCITINSTVGLQALDLGIPTKVMGRTMYNMEGITYQGKLDTFWSASSVVNKNNFTYYKEYVIAKTQINGTFYSDTFFKRKS